MRKSEKRQRRSATVAEASRLCSQWLSCGRPRTARLTSGATAILREAAVDAATRADGRTENGVRPAAVHRDAAACRPHGSQVGEAAGVAEGVDAPSSSRSAWPAPAIETRRRPTSAGTRVGQRRAAAPSRFGQRHRASPMLQLADQCLARRHSICNSIGPGQARETR